MSEEQETIQKIKFVNVEGKEGAFVKIIFIYKGGVYALLENSICVGEDLGGGVVSLDELTVFEDESTVQNFKKVLPDELQRAFGLILKEALKYSTNPVLNLKRRGESHIQG